MLLKPSSRGGFQEPISGPELRPGQNSSRQPGFATTAAIAKNNAGTHAAIGRLDPHPQHQQTGNRQNGRRRDHSSNTMNAEAHAATGQSSSSKQLSHRDEHHHNRHDHQIQQHQQQQMQYPDRGHHDQTRHQHQNRRPTKSTHEFHRLAELSMDKSQLEQRFRTRMDGTFQDLQLLGPPSSPPTHLSPHKQQLQQQQQHHHHQQQHGQLKEQQQQGQQLQYGSLPPPRQFPEGYPSSYTPTDYSISPDEAEDDGLDQENIDEEDSVVDSDKENRPIEQRRAGVINFNKHSNIINSSTGPSTARTAAAAETATTSSPSLRLVVPATRDVSESPEQKRRIRSNNPSPEARHHYHQHHQHHHQHPHPVQNIIQQGSSPDNQASGEHHRRSGRRGREQEHQGHHHENQQDHRSAVSRLTSYPPIQDSPPDHKRQQSQQHQMLQQPVLTQSPKQQRRRQESHYSPKEKQHEVRASDRNNDNDGDAQDPGYDSAEISFEREVALARARREGLSKSQQSNSESTGRGFGSSGGGVGQPIVQSPQYNPLNNHTGPAPAPEGLSLFENSGGAGQRQRQYRQTGHSKQQPQQPQHHHFSDQPLILGNGLGVTNSQLGPSFEQDSQLQLLDYNRDSDLTTPLQGRLDHGRGLVLEDLASPTRGGFDGDQGKELQQKLRSQNVQERKVPATTTAHATGEMQDNKNGKHIHQKQERQQPKQQQQQQPTNQDRKRAAPLIRPQDYDRLKIELGPEDRFMELAGSIGEGQAVSSVLETLKGMIRELKVEKKQTNSKVKALERALKQALKELELRKQKTMTTQPSLTVPVVENGARKHMGARAASSPKGAQKTGAGVGSGTGSGSLSKSELAIQRKMEDQLRDYLDERENMVQENGRMETILKSLQKRVDELEFGNAKGGAQFLSLAAGQPPPPASATTRPGHQQFYNDDEVGDDDDERPKEKDQMTDFDNETSEEEDIDDNDDNYEHEMSSIEMDLLRRISGQPDMTAESLGMKARKTKKDAKHKNLKKSTIVEDDGTGVGVNSPLIQRRRYHNQLQLQQEGQEPKMQHQEAEKHKAYQQSLTQPRLTHRQSHGHSNENSSSGSAGRTKKEKQDGQRGKQALVKKVFIHHVLYDEGISPTVVGRHAPTFDSKAVKEVRSEDSEDANEFERDGHEAHGGVLKIPNGARKTSTSGPHADQADKNTQHYYHYYESPPLPALAVPEGDLANTKKYSKPNEDASEAGFGKNQSTSQTEKRSKARHATASVAENEDDEADVDDAVQIPVSLHRVQALMKAHDPRKCIVCANEQKMDDGATSGGQQLRHHAKKASKAKVTPARTKPQRQHTLHCEECGKSKDEVEGSEEEGNEEESDEEHFTDALNRRSSRLKVDGSTPAVAATLERKKSTSSLRSNDKNVSEISEVVQGKGKGKKTWFQEPLQSHRDEEQEEESEDEPLIRRRSNGKLSIKAKVDDSKRQQPKVTRKLAKELALDLEQESFEFHHHPTPVVQSKKGKKKQRKQSENDGSGSAGETPITLMSLISTLRDKYQSSATSAESGSEPASDVSVSSNDEAECLEADDDQDREEEDEEEEEEPHEGEVPSKIPMDLTSPKTLTVRRHPPTTASGSGSSRLKPPSLKRPVAATTKSKRRVSLSPETAKLVQIQEATTTEDDISDQNGDENDDEEGLTDDREDVTPSVVILPVVTKEAIGSLMKLLDQEMQTMRNLCLFLAADHNTDEKRSGQAVGGEGGIGRAEAAQQETNKMDAELLVLYEQMQALSADDNNLVSLVSDEQNPLVARLTADEVLDAMERKLDEVYRLHMKYSLVIMQEQARLTTVAEKQTQNTEELPRLALVQGQEDIDQQQQEKIADQVAAEFAYEQQLQRLQDHEEAEYQGQMLEEMQYRQREAHREEDERVELDRRLMYRRGNDGYECGEPVTSFHEHELPQGHHEKHQQQLFQTPQRQVMLQPSHLQYQHQADIGAQSRLPAVTLSPPLSSNIASLPAPVPVSVTKIMSPMMMHSPPSVQRTSYTFRQPYSPVVGHHPLRNMMTMPSTTTATNTSSSSRSASVLSSHIPSPGRPNQFRQLQPQSPSSSPGPPSKTSIIQIEGVTTALDMNTEMQSHQLVPDGSEEGHVVGELHVISGDDFDKDAFHIVSEDEDNLEDLMDGEEGEEE